ncbi:MAG: putative sulfate exporter family transporter [Myxococcaceae bacterium]
MSERVKGILFVLLAIASLTPWVTAPIALVAGLAFALTLGTPAPAKVKQAQTFSLQAAVVGLGAGMNLAVVGRVGVLGVGQTLVTLVVTLSLALLLARVLRTERTTSLLIGVGTAICGGSAIAAVAPAIGAKSEQSSLSLAVVFLLNAAALIIFPKLGTFVGLSAEQFGLWCALAIHDTSSVVGASNEFGPVALAIGTTVKLARALWIIPLTLVLARVWKAEGEAKGQAKRPWFILGFVAAAALVTWVPALSDVGHLVHEGARHVLVASLFLVGAGVSRDALKKVGARPLALGVVLWAVVATGSLAAIRFGLAAVPSLEAPASSSQSR